MSWFKKSEREKAISSLEDMMYDLSIKRKKYIHERGNCTELYETLKDYEDKVVTFPLHGMNISLPVSYMLDVIAYSDQFMKGQLGEISELMDGCKRNLKKLEE